MKLRGDIDTQPTYPIVAVRDGIVFPGTENVLLFGRSKSVAAIESALHEDKKVVLVMQKNGRLNDPLIDDLYAIGVVASIKKILKGDQGEISALINGEARVRITEIAKVEPYFEAKVEELDESVEQSEEIEALVKHITAELKRAVNLGKGIDFVSLMNIMSGVSARDFSDHIAMILDLKTKDKQTLLEEIDLLKRLQKELEFITNEIKVLEIERNITLKTQRKFEKGMKDTILREKLKTIEEELGGENREDREIQDLRAKIKKAKMPEEAEEKANKELDRLVQMSQYNPEASYIRTYLEWLVELPWSVESKTDLVIKNAEKILNNDHYGLKKVKERIIEYLAVLKLREMTEKKIKNKKDIKQPTILCFVGPPGVGKTSLGRSIARSLGQNFVPDQVLQAELRKDHHDSHDQFYQSHRA